MNLLTYISKSVSNTLEEKIEKVRQLLEEGFSDVQICNDIGLNWEEFWAIVENLNNFE